MCIEREIGLGFGFVIPVGNYLFGIKLVSYQVENGQLRIYPYLINKNQAYQLKVGGMGLKVKPVLHPQEIIYSFQTHDARRVKVSKEEYLGYHICLFSFSYLRNKDLFLDFLADALKSYDGVRDSLQGEASTPAPGYFPIAAGVDKDDIQNATQFSIIAKSFSIPVPEISESVWEILFRQHNITGDIITSFNKSYKLIYDSLQKTAEGALT